MDLLVYSVTSAEQWMVVDLDASGAFCRNFCVVGLRAGDRRRNGRVAEWVFSV